MLLKCPEITHLDYCWEKKGPEQASPSGGTPSLSPSEGLGAEEKTAWFAAVGSQVSVKKSHSGYTIICTPCLETGKKAIYEGEIGRNCYSRGMEQEDNVNKKLDDSPLWKHCSLDQGGEKVQFTMKALRNYRGCLLRQVNEPVRIMSSKADMLLNLKKNISSIPPDKAGSSVRAAG